MTTEKKSAVITCIHLHLVTSLQSYYICYDFCINLFLSRKIELAVIYLSVSLSLTLCLSSLSLPLYLPLSVSISVSLSISFSFFLLSLSLSPFSQSLPLSLPPLTPLSLTHTHTLSPPPLSLSPYQRLAALREGLELVIADVRYPVGPSVVERRHCLLGHHVQLVLLLLHVPPVRLRLWAHGHD